ncbi:LOW QUALITY PROTEIN: hypothetical protein QTO34_019884 [Cnephaeus nilssonii]|uniref:Uncharacterized protein n=1 Tax=Cnephaeus nilssonii TaxID=3371016 RepID=A0AA40HYJ1_CNENI|nr:LOW QUALITY PROTEIN: hypothetical protein QTO34_019884 [Eptesicus nilssonii]
MAAPEAFGRPGAPADSWPGPPRSKAKAGDLAGCLLRRKAFRKPPQQPEAFGRPGAPADSQPSGAPVQDPSADIPRGVLNAAVEAGEAPSTSAVLASNDPSFRLSFSPARQRQRTEKRLGSFSTSPTAFVKEFRDLSQAYDLTWHDIHVILSSTLTSDERERVLGAATDHADQIHFTDASMPVGAQAIPRQEPGWEYQLDTPEGCPDSATPITLAELRVKLQVAGKQISFLIDTGATFSVLPSFSRPLFPSTISVMGIDGKPTCPLATGPLPCLLDNSPITHSFLVMPSCPVPLLGRDILTKLGATLQLTQSLSASLLLPLLAPSLHGNTGPPLPAFLVNPKWLLDTIPQSGSDLRTPPRFPPVPFPISLTHCQGLKPLITRLLGQGLLIPIDSPCNTLILPVRKADGTYQLVQDLRLINKTVVPNPYTLLSRIPSGITHFSVLDLKDAFFTIPLDPDSYHLFAFTWEDPDKQGFRDSPHLFGQALARDLQQCSLELSTLLQYVDDLLLCSPFLDISRRQRAGLLNFLGDKGYCVSPAKAQLSAPTVTYLGICLTPNSRGLIVDRAQAIRDLQPPTSADLVLSRAGFFRHWVPNFALLAKPLYQAAKETPTGPLSSPSLVRQAFSKFQDALLASPHLSLPDISKPFQLFTHEKQGIAMGVLTQPLGPAFTPIAYLSRQLDPTVRGWQPCLRALAAAAALTKEAQKICLQQPLQVFFTHRLQDLLSHLSLSLLAPSHMQELHLLPEPSHSPSCCLHPTCGNALLPRGRQGPHSTQVGLSDIPLSNPDLTLFVDGSSCLDPQGHQKASYAVVTLERILETAQLPEGTTSQKAELIALTRALHLAKGRRVNIYTDSKYSFLIAHCHAVIWRERGFLSTKGLPIINARLITRLLEALQLPSQVAIVHCRGHQTDGYTGKRPSRHGGQRLNSG